MQRQKAIQKEIGCVFISINPNEANFKKFKENS